MILIHVHVHVKPEAVQAFVEASLANATASRKEPGNLRFDVVQQEDDPTRFVLVEAWRDAAAHSSHRDTTHYIVWRDKVNPLMATVRTSTKYRLLHPQELV
ncbi:MAG: putative quinol monooxygenase [Opitutaceae bacterium]|nr:putative quinol monooxygenase [Opitutaceae bacterium]